MSIAQAAKAITAFPDVNVPTTHGTFSLRVVMLSVAGSESGWDVTADGDCGLGGPQCGACSDANGSATSWGLWQIHNVHSAYLTQMTGSTHPCDWRTWLFDADNNAKAALHVYQAQGLSAWTTYMDGTWSANIDQAKTQMENGATAESNPAAATPKTASNSGPVVTAKPVITVAGVVGIAAILIGLIEIDWGWKHR